MVRVAGLVGREESGIERPDIAGLSTREQLTAIAAAAHSEMKLKYRYFFALVKELEKYAISFSGWRIFRERRGKALNGTTRKWSFRFSRPWPLMRHGPFLFLPISPLISPLNCGMPKDIRKIAFIQVPSVLPRVIPVKGRGMKNPSFSWKTSSWHTAGSSSKD